MSLNLQNWARNLAYGATQIYRPTSIEEVQSIVRASTKVKALGTRHSFNTIADTVGNLISTEHLNRIVSLDKERMTVTVEGGIRYGDLGRYLDREGFALQNLASLPHISVAGACATATHGSGVGNGNLATSVVGLDLVTANGEVVSFSQKEREREFNGAVVGLGALGIVSRLTLKVVPKFEIKQNVFDNLPFAALENHFEEIVSCGYSVSLFTFWSSDFINQVWIKSTASTPAPLDLFGAKPATSPRSPLPEGNVENCTDQLGVLGPWYDRLPHFRMGFTPSSGEELQTEYFVPRNHAWVALSEINAMRDQVAPLLYTTEIRCIAADDLWMSPNYCRDSVAIHFTWKQDWERVRKLLPTIEERLAQFQVSPHWGKLFTMAPDKLQTLYEKLPDFLSLMKSCDPTGKFRNDFIEQLV